MNQENLFETDELETDPESFESMESSEGEYEGDFEGSDPGPGGKVPHPQFGMVTPIGQQGESFEADEVFENGAPAGGKVPHPQFGMVTPLSGEYGQEFEGEGGYGSEGEEELEFEALSEEIIGGDERFRVTRTTQRPWRWVCYLEVYFTEGGRRWKGEGSGLLISPRHVLTCAHNVIINSTRRPVASVNVIPGCNGVPNMPFGRHPAASWRGSDEYRARLDPRFDFGLITLRSPIGNTRQRRLAGRPLGYWSKPGSGTTILQTQKGDPRLRGKRATLSGYPGDKPDGQQWAAKGQVVNMTPAAGRELFYYSADSCAGHSGSPIWIRRGARCGLIGIHTGPCIVGPDCREFGRSGCSNTPDRRRSTSNRGVLITPQLWARVRSWM